MSAAVVHDQIARRSTPPQNPSGLPLRITSDCSTAVGFGLRQVGFQLASVGIDDVLGSTRLIEPHRPDTLSPHAPSANSIPKLRSSWP